MSSVEKVNCQGECALGRVFDQRENFIVDER